MAAEPIFTVEPGRGPRRYPGHDGSCWDVVNTLTGEKEGRYVTEPAAREYADQLNAAPSS